MKTALIHQSHIIANAIPMTPRFIHIPNTTDSATLKMTVEKTERYIVYLTSPAALSPFENGEEIGNTNALNKL